MIRVDGFRQPRGPRLAVGSVDGYPLDLRSKAPSPVSSAPAGHGLRVPRIQEGIGANERFLAGEGAEWLELARIVADELLRSQRDDGGWGHSAPCPHTYAISPPWLSAMAQGQGASLLVRLALRTGEDRYAAAAQQALDPLWISVADGGVAAEMHGHRLPQEYPTQPASHVLNGAIFALWGAHDVAVALDDADARVMFEDGVDALVELLPAWDLGWWSRYDLFPHPCVNVASPAYHRLHSDQLDALAEMTERPVLAEAAARFRRYAASPVNRARAVCAKVRFRAHVPRSGRRVAFSKRRAQAVQGR